jgi:hypothetical protein
LCIDGICKFAIADVGGTMVKVRKGNLVNGSRDPIKVGQGMQKRMEPFDDNLILQALSDQGDDFVG